MAQKPIVKSRPTVVAWLLVAIGFVAVAAGSAIGWRWYQMPARVRNALPAVPAGLAAKSAELERRIKEADASARDGGRELERVADLGYLYHANGYLREAEACWGILHREQPREARWPYYLADLRRTAGDDAAVEALLAETVRLAPNYATAWLKLADLEFKTGRAADAEPRYRRRLAMLPADPYARLGLARIAMQRGEDAEARRLIEEIVRDTPDFPTAHNLLAEMLAAEGKAEEAFRHRHLGRETGRFREAADPWMEGMEAWCFDPDRLALLGSMAYQMQRGDRGVSLLERAVELAPDDPNAQEHLGTLYLQVGQPVEAQAAFERALALPDPTNRRVMLLVKLTDALRMQKRFAEALRLVQDELPRAPSAYELHNQLGAVFADLGRVEESVAAYRKAVLLAPNDPDSNFNLGAGLVAMGRRDEGIQHLKQSLTLQPTYPRSLVLLGRLALEAGRMDEAYGYLKPLYDSHPEQATSRLLLAQYHRLLGEAADKRRDAVAAERHYRDGLKVDPENADLNATLGVTLLLQRRVDEAIVPFEAFRRVRPEDPQASLFLGQCYALLGRVPEARQVLREGVSLAERNGNTVTANHCREILQHLPPE